MQLLPSSTTLSFLRHDGQLLRQFAVEQDEAAFVEILRRHGAMVLGVCRRVLHHQQDAEDATQAVFLSLAQQASKLTGNHSLAAWLHCVARRTAGHALRQAQKRQRREHKVARPEAITAHDADAVRWLLDEELDRLPERYRLPIILCCIEGHTRHTAADMLGWPAGTVAGRLARARSILQKRLTARGVALAAATGVLMPCIGQGMGVALLNSIASLANQWIQGKELLLSPTVLSLMHVTGSAVSGSRLGMLALLSLFGLLGWISVHRVSEQPVESNPEQPIVSPVSALAENDRTDVEGIVLADGKPVSGATVWLTTHHREIPDGMFYEVLDTVKTDHQGRFRVHTKREVDWSTLYARSEEGRFAYHHSFDMNSLKPLPTSGVEMNLMPIRKAQGCLRNHRGEPLSQVTIKPDFLFFGPIDPGKKIQRRSQIPVPEFLQPFWTAKTNKEGRFTLDALPVDCSFNGELLLPGGESIALSWNCEKSMDIILPELGQALIRFKGVDDPVMIKNIVLNLSMERPPVKDGYVISTNHRFTGTKGLDMLAKGLLPGNGVAITQTNPQTCAYYMEEGPQAAFVIKPGETTEITLELKRAVEVVGNVINVQSQRGVAGAHIEVISFHPVKKAGMPRMVKTNEQGRFLAYVVPGDIQARIDFLPNNLVIERFKLPEKIAGQTGETVSMPELKAKPGRSLQGEVVTIDGRPVVGANINSYELEYQRDYPRSQSPAYTDEQGRFHLRVLTNDTINLFVSSKEGTTAEPVIVDLRQPTPLVRITVDPKNAAYVTGRFVDNDGKPVVGVKFSLIWWFRNIDRDPETEIGKHLDLEPTDAQGRFRSGTLFPGQRYELCLQNGLTPTEYFEGAKFTSKAGQTHDLGTIEIKSKPEKK